LQRDLPHALCAYCLPWSLTGLKPRYAYPGFGDIRRAKAGKSAKYVGAFAAQTTPQIFEK
jgi:hypothetical protein